MDVRDRRHHFAMPRSALQKFTRHPALKGLLLLGLLEDHALPIAELDGPAARDIGPSERP